MGAGFVLEGDALEVGGYLVVCCFEGVVVVFEAEGAQLVAFFEDFAAGHDVDCKGSDDTDPMGSISQVYELEAGFRFFLRTMLDRSTRRCAKSPIHGITSTIASVRC